MKAVYAKLCQRVWQSYLVLQMKQCIFSNCFSLRQQHQSKNNGFLQKPLLDRRRNKALIVITGASPFYCAFIMAIILFTLPRLYCRLLDEQNYNFTVVSCLFYPFLFPCPISTWQQSKETTQALLRSYRQTHQRNIRLFTRRTLYQISNNSTSKR